MDKQIEDLDAKTTDDIIDLSSKYAAQQIATLMNVRAELVERLVSQHNNRPLSVE